MARGNLRVYLGAAPGVGKTFAMLNEGRRRHDRGTDVVVGFVETHGRAAHRSNRSATSRSFPRKRDRVPRHASSRRWTSTRSSPGSPQVALVDELAHTNVPGSQHEKRWQDVEELLDAGIDVISTVNIQHLESVNDVVERITGVQQRETLPDEVVRRADQVELVDMTPEALRRRMAHGNIYKPEKVDAALANYFRPGNLAALRELALLWVADKVDDSLQQYMEDHGITAAWETRERVVVALTGAPGRRAPRAAGGAHGDAHEGRPARRARARGRRARRSAARVARATPRAARRPRRHVPRGRRRRPVAGARRRSRAPSTRRSSCSGRAGARGGAELLRGSVINRVVRASGDIDVHVISTRGRRRGAGRAPRPPRGFSLGVSRAAAGHRAASSRVVGAAAAHAACSRSARDSVSLGSDLLLYLLLVVVDRRDRRRVGRGRDRGRRVPARQLVPHAADPHVHDLRRPERARAGRVPRRRRGRERARDRRPRAARSKRRGPAARRRRSCGSRARCSPRTIRCRASCSSCSRRSRLRSVAVLRPATATTTGRSWRTPARPVLDTARGRDRRRSSCPAATLFAYVGPNLTGDDRRVLNAFVAQLAVALASRELRAEASAAVALAEADALRTALLRAVSHDLRTPLASIKASASTLLADDLHLDDETVRQLHADDRRGGRPAQRARQQPARDEPPAGRRAAARERRRRRSTRSSGRALVSLGDRAGGSRGRRARLAAARARRSRAARARDRERRRQRARVVAARASPCGSKARVVGDSVVLRVIDRGPGIPPADRDRVFQPFQRLGDARRGGAASGSGSRSRAASPRRSAASCSVEDTPGGGTTMTFSFRRVRVTRRAGDEQGARDRGRGAAAARAAHLPRGARLRRRARRHRDAKVSTSPRASTPTS